MDKGETIMNLWPLMYGIYPIILISITEGAILGQLDCAFIWYMMRRTRHTLLSNNGTYNDHYNKYNK